MSGRHLILLAFIMTMLASCEEQAEHTAPAINDRDSVAAMTTYGVNTLISDSGIIKYRVVAERWEVNDKRNPKRWILDKGVFMEQFDEKFHVDMYFQADTAYNYYEKKLWEFHGNVRVRTKDGLRFASEELFYDQVAHELYSTKFSRLVTPERTIQGSFFRSDEKMHRYQVYNTRGSFEKGDFSNNETADTLSSAPDTTKAKFRQPTVPVPRTPNQQVITN